MSPFDSMTRKRPLAEVSPTKESRVEFVIWETKESGVVVAGPCAEERAPATSIQAAAAHKKAVNSLIIKNMNERSKCSLGPIRFAEPAATTTSILKQSGRTL